MAKEAVKVELTNTTGFPRRFTCASGTAITLGSLLKFATPRTAALSDGTADPIAGIASMDKEGDDYSATISVWTDGIFEMYASGAITAGQPVMSAADANFPNHVKKALSAVQSPASGAAVIGYALANISDEAAGAVRIKL